MSTPTRPDNPLGGLDAARVFDMAITPAPAASAAPAAAELGALLPDYAVQAIIGRGGMGAVYRAVQRNLARDVAIKVMPVEMGDTPGFAERFRREAMTTAGLAHPAIVAVHDVGETVAGHHYYVMDLVDGEDLAVRMARGRLPVEASVALLEQVCGAVEAAHARGIVHRDIKPSNILLTKDGKPMLADFGLALLTEKHLECSRLTLGGTTLGTLEYAAPEQLEGTGATAASDQYSLGVLAYELLTGELPRGVFEPPSARNAAVDPAFDGVVLRALQSDPARRYDSVAAFRAAMLQAADRRSQQERRLADARSQLRRRTRIAVSAMGVAVLTVGLAGFAWQQRQRAIAGECAAQLTRAEAERLVEFMLDELQGHLYEVNRLDVLDQVVAKVAAYYDAVPDAEQADDGFQLRKAEFLELRGALDGQQGRKDSELALYREAQAIRTALVTRHAHDQAYLRSFQEGEFALAAALTAQGRHQDAFAAHDRIIAVLPAGSEAPSILMSRAMQSELLALMGRHEEAAATAETQLAHVDRLLTRPEMEREFGIQNVSGILLRLLASEAARRGDWKLAARHDESRAALYDRTLPAGQRHGYREQMFADAALSAAERLLAAGDAHAAEARAASAFAVFERLARDAGGTGSHANLAGFAARAWTAARRARQQPENRAILEQQAGAWLLGRMEKVNAEEQEAFARLLGSPGDPERHQTWATASETAGRRIEAAQGTAAALAFYERQTEKLEAPWQAAPPDSWWNLSLSATLNRHGEILERLREWAKAEPIFRRALELRMRLLKAHRGEATREPRNVVSSAQRLARSLVAQQRPAEALAVISPLLADLKDLPSDRHLEWRANVGNTVAETLPALAPDAARDLAAAARDFLLAPGPDKLSAAEKESLAALEKAAAQ